MNRKIDVRAWNLLTGVALIAAGCGGRVASVEAGETGEAESSEAEAGECVNSGDCPAGYDCYDGVCGYFPYDDGWVPYYECYSDEDCVDFEFCDYGYCLGLGPPSPECGEPAGMVTFSIPDADAVALTFADVDADGRDELVFATQDELVVYDDGASIISTRTPGPIADMVAGEFDMMPGADLLVLQGDALLPYRSHGDGSFLPLPAIATQLGLTVGLIAADFDAVPPTDMLVWGLEGAYIDAGGQVSVITTGPVTSAAVHELGAPEPGFALRQVPGGLNLYTLDGQLIASGESTTNPADLAAWARGSSSEYVSLVHHPTWSRAESRAMYGGIETWPIYGMPQRIFAANLDGGDIDDLVYFDGPSAVVQLNPREANDCHAPVADLTGNPIDAAFGDYDGDGDDELAILTDSGWITLFDGG